MTPHPLRHRRRAAALLAAFAVLLAPGAALAAAPSTATIGTTTPASEAAGTGGPTVTTTPAPTPGTVATVTVARQGAHHSSGGLAGWAIALAALAAVLAIACLVWAFFRITALEPHWLSSLRHSLAEAQYRASATWAEFTDWLRLGH